MRILILNYYKDDISDAEYIGRYNKAKSLPESPLKNPYVLKEFGGQYERGESVGAFEGYLEEAIRTKNAKICGELNRLYALAKKGTLKLFCYCTPNKACHGHVIAHVLLHKLKQANFLSKEEEGQITELNDILEPCRELFENFKKSSRLTSRSKGSMRI